MCTTMTTTALCTERGTGQIQWRKMIHVELTANAGENVDVPNILLLCLSRSGTTVQQPIHLTHDALRGVGESAAEAQETGKNAIAESRFNFGRQQSEARGEEHHQRNLPDRSHRSRFSDYRGCPEAVTVRDSGTISLSPQRGKEMSLYLLCLSLPYMCTS